MAGYTRQDTANNIANGNVIDADDFDAEYNAIEAGFNASTGHAHDGTAGEGAPITKVGPAQDLIVSGTALTPKTTNTLDLGTASVQYKNAWFDGTVDTDALTVSANATVGGTLGVTGIITATGGVTGNVTGNVTGTVSNVSNHDTDDISEGSTNQYFTTARARASVSATGSLSYNSGTGVISFTQGNTDTVAEGTTNLYYTDARATAAAKAAISVTDAGGDGSLTYSAGAITYTGPSAAETRAHFSGGTGVSITNGVVAIGQAVGTTSNVTFNNTVVNGNLTVNGTTTTVNTETLNLADNQIVLNSNETGTPTQNGGIEIERGTAANKTLVWNEADDKWTVGSETFVAGTFEGALSGNSTTATTLQTARTIGGVSFNGSSNINLPGVNTAGNQNTSGNAATATALATSRTISLTGDVSGSASFNGTANATITATIADDSHNHVISNVDGLQTALDSKYVASTQTEATWEAGTSTTESLVSPAKVKAAIEENSITQTSGSAPYYGVRAWGMVDGHAKVDGGNFASFNSTTNTVTFTTPMPHANYAVALNGPWYGNVFSEAETVNGFRAVGVSSGGNVGDISSFEFIVVC
jgi:hypothetical protein